MTDALASLDPILFLLCVLSLALSGAALLFAMEAAARSRAALRTAQRAERASRRAESATFGT